MKLTALLSFLLLFFISLASAEYKRIVSLAPLATESLYELGIDKEIVGITVYCPKGENPKEIIGTLLEPNLEKIAGLKPDLIVSTKEGNNKAAVEKLMRLGFNVYVMNTSESFEEICKNYLDLAKEAGKEKEAEKIITNSRVIIENIREKLNINKPEGVFWEVGARPLYTAAGKSFVKSYNYYTKTENIYKDIDMRYPLVDIEDVVKRNPDIIILVNMGDIGAEEISVWKKYKSVNAVKNNKIFMTDVNDVFTPTPSTFAKGVKLLSKTIYPEIFNAE